MKQACLLFTFSFFALLSSAQDFTRYKDVELKTAEDCRNYDSVALQSADYLLSTPVDENLNRLAATQFLIKWMAATPDYSFSLDAKVSKYGDKDDFILAVYMAALTHHAFENKDAAADSTAFIVSAFHTLAVYCSNPDNHVKLDKNLKKLIDADKNDKLIEYIGL
jgi:hypothetical protein